MKIGVWKTFFKWRKEKLCDTILKLSHRFGLKLLLGKANGRHTALHLEYAALLFTTHTNIFPTSWTKRWKTKLRRESLMMSCLQEIVICEHRPDCEYGELKDSKTMYLLLSKNPKPSIKVSLTCQPYAHYVFYFFRVVIDCWKY